jgi:UMF1 family MFS transporter
MKGLLERFALHRPELRAWALYDWANSAFILVVITAVFPIYFQTVAADGLDPERANFWFGITTTVSLAVVAVASPVLGALGDFLGRRKRFMALFLLLGLLATGAMYFIRQGDWILALVLFGIGNFAVSTSFVFYDSLLPHIAVGDELDRVSTAGYALGYLGSGLLLIVNLAWIQKPELFGIPDAGVATRLSFLSVALWWGGFAIPLFRQVAEPPRQIEADESRGASPLRVTLSRLVETFHELRGDYREAFKMLVAVLIYNDGIGTIIRMAAIYAVTLQLPQSSVILAILMVQFVGIPFAFLFGQVAGRIGPKRAILVALAVYVAISLVAYFMTTIREFYLLAFLVGMVQGGAQALSRSLFASMIPRHKAAEFFGFFSVFEKFAGIAGPLIFSLMIWLTGSSREAILSVIAFFAVGGFLLWRVDVETGRTRARAAEGAVRVLA